MWIKRDISNIFKQNTDLVQVLMGPRQCGKTSLLMHLDSDFTEISMDDPNIRALAEKDPMMFLEQFEGKKLFIDEAQLAPQIFSALKRKADLIKRKDKNSQTQFRLTGSNQILMDKNVKESLTGRASYFQLNTLSVSEILDSQSQPMIDIILKGGWPELYATPDKDHKKFLDDYITSYVEKDIVLAAGIQKVFDFTRFLGLIAHRTAQVLNYSELAKEVGVDVTTIKDWISILERMKIIALVMPYFSNHSKRLIKSPKLYFIDTGLACRLQGWTSSIQLLGAPQLGALFETLVFSELYKMIQNYNLSWKLFHWRSRDGEEIDFVIQKSPNEFLFVESKVSNQFPPDISTYPEIKKVFKSKIPNLVLCHMDGERALGKQVPLRFLKKYLGVGE